MTAFSAFYDRRQQVYRACNRLTSNKQWWANSTCAKKTQTDFVAEWLWIAILRWRISTWCAGRPYVVPRWSSNSRNWESSHVVETEQPSFSCPKQFCSDNSLCSGNVCPVRKTVQFFRIYHQQNGSCLLPENVNALVCLRDWLKWYLLAIVCSDWQSERCISLVAKFNKLKLFSVLFTVLSL